jgi:hypothetical protein
MTAVTMMAMMMVVVVTTTAVSTAVVGVGVGVACAVGGGSAEIANFVQQHAMWEREGVGWGRVGRGGGGG